MGFMTWTDARSICYRHVGRYDSDLRYSEIRKHCSRFVRLGCPERDGRCRLHLKNRASPHDPSHSERPGKDDLAAYVAANESAGTCRSFPLPK